MLHECTVETEVGAQHRVRHSRKEKAHIIVAAEDSLRTPRERKHASGTSVGLSARSIRRAVQRDLEGMLRDSGEWMAFE